jgi:uncharacterized protein (DUF885 family)
MDENTVADAENQTTTPDGVTESKVSHEDVLKELESLKAERAKDEELIKKLRKFEKENKARAEAESKAKEEALKEQDQYKELYEQLIGKMKEQKVESALDSVLGEMKAKSTKTVKALVDKSQIQFDGEEVNTKALKELVNGLKKEHSVLFEEDAPVAPSVKKAGESDPVGGFEKEIRAAKSQKEIESVMRKYGKI